METRSQWQKLMTCHMLIPTQTKNKTQGTNSHFFVSLLTRRKTTARTWWLHVGFNHTWAATDLLLPKADCGGACTSLSAACVKMLCCIFKRFGRVPHPTVRYTIFFVPSSTPSAVALEGGGACGGSRWGCTVWPLWSKVRGGQTNGHKQGRGCGAALRLTAVVERYFFAISSGSKDHDAALLTTWCRLCLFVRGDQ